MKRYFAPLLLLAYFTTFISCKKEAAADLADSFVGTYKGTYTEGSGVSAVSFNNAVVIVSKTQSSEVKINLTAFGVSFDFKGNTKDNSQIDIPSQTYANTANTLSGTADKSGTTFGFKYAYREAGKTTSTNASFSGVKQ